MSDALALLGFYFTLIGFISGLFFTRLDSWYGSVRQFAGKLAALTERSDFEKAGPEADGLAASAPRGSFTAVGLLLAGLALLGLLVPVQKPVVNPWLFLYGPMLAVVAVYWIGGVILLRKAGQLLQDARTIIKRGLSGEQP
jgi:hypothetical protein